jgi:hypothetical protein
MTSAMRGALSAGMLALAVWCAGQLSYSLFFCRPHRAFEATASGHPSVVLDRGERVARSGDAIFTCTTTHRIGPMVLHEDLDCYCAPQSMPPLQLAQTLGGSCEIDHLFPSRTDESGSCRFARCNAYVGP